MPGKTVVDDLKQPLIDPADAHLVDSSDAVASSAGGSYSFDHLAGQEASLNIRPTSNVGGNAGSKSSDSAAGSEVSLRPASTGSRAFEASLAGRHGSEGQTIPEERLGSAALGSVESMGSETMGSENFHAFRGSTSGKPLPGLDGSGAADVVQPSDVQITVGDGAGEAGAPLSKRDSKSGSISSSYSGQGTPHTPKSPMSDQPRAITPSGAYVGDIRHIMHVAPRPDYGVVICYIQRERPSWSGWLSGRETYTLYRQGLGMPDEPMLTARVSGRLTGSTYTLFTIGIDAGDEVPIMSMKSNWSGSRFTLYEHVNGEDPRPVGAVMYRHNLDTRLGGFRSLKVIIPKMESESPQTNKTGASANQGLGSDAAPYVEWEAQMWDTRPASNIHQLVSKWPKYNLERDEYYMDLPLDGTWPGGRLRASSASAFQLVEGVNDAVLMLFGRSSKDMFVMDFTHPLSASQAFCIALSAMDSKWCYVI